jgi:eukaryotic-like serine/threonine-protein kinase
MGDTGRLIAGRYRLQAPIGRGAMGVVWRARDQLLDRDVAIKEVLISAMLTPQERANAYQRTLREAKTAARLNHPGVVTVYDVAEDEGRPWIIMQLVSAQSLDQVLAASGPLSPRRTAEMGRQLLAALSSAHAAGVLHRDVKPSNVLLGRDDHAVLTDFGIATFAGDTRLTQTGMVMGSPGFTAPERIRGEDATPASDLWSLGATLYAAVEGHGPFERRGGAITTMSAIINEEAPAAPTAGALGPVIAALLRREPSERPDAATATRMINEVLPQLPTRIGAGPAGYEPTSLSQSPASPGPAAGPVAPGPVVPGPVVPGPVAQGWPGVPERTITREPAGAAQASADTHGGPGSAADTTPTKTELAYGDAPPPDFSSWYDPAPRSGSSRPWSGGSGSAYEAGHAAPAAPPSVGPPPARPGPAAPPGNWPQYQPGSPPGRRRSGGRWKIGIVVLAVLGAIAGATTVVLLMHNTTSSGTPLGHSSSVNTSPPATGPGSATTPATGGSTTLPSANTQIVDAINMPRTGALPAGFTTYSQPAASNENAGFSLAAPSNWTSSASGYQTYLKDPSANANILIDLTPHTYPNDMVREAKYIKANSLNRFPGYVQLGLQATNIRGTPGAFWKFTWDDQGVQQEVIDLLMVLQTPAGSQSYALYMTAPASMWTALRPVFDEMVETFTTVAGGNGGGKDVHRVALPPWVPPATAVPNTSRWPLRAPRRRTGTRTCSGCTPGPT